MKNQNTPKRMLGVENHKATLTLDTPKGRRRIRRTLGMKQGQHVNRRMRLKAIRVANLRERREAANVAAAKKGKK